MPMARNRDDVVGKVLQRLDHDVLLNRRVVIVSSPSVLVQEAKSLGTTSDSNSSPVRVVAIEGPFPVQRTRPWFQVSPLQLPEGTSWCPRAEIMPCYRTCP